MMRLWVRGGGGGGVGGITQRDTQHTAVRTHAHKTHTSGDSDPEHTRMCPSPPVCVSQAHTHTNVWPLSPHTRTHTHYTFWGTMGVCANDTHTDAHPRTPTIAVLFATPELLDQVASFLPPRDRTSFFSTCMSARKGMSETLEDIQLQTPAARTADAETKVVRHGASLLRHTQNLRRMKLRGDGGLLGRALHMAPPLNRLVALDLCKCNVGPSQAWLIAKALWSGATPALEHLDLSENPNMGPESGQALTRALESGKLSKLQGLLLFGDRLKEGTMGIAKCIRAGLLPELEILDLSGNMLGTEVAMMLAAALRELHCRGLEQLGLSDNKVGSDGIMALASALKIRGYSSECAQLEKLHLGGNEVGPEAGRMLADSLSDERCGGKLALLELHSAKLKGEGLRAITDVLSRGACSSLVELWLDNNVDFVEDHDAVHGLMRVLGSGAVPQLEALGLNYTDLDVEGAVALASALRAFHRPALQRIDLRSASIGPEGMTALADALVEGACPGLRWLDLTGNWLQAQGIQELARALDAGAGKMIRRLDLHAVGMEEEGLSYLTTSLSNGACPEMVGLGLALNRIGPQGAKSVASVMATGALSKLVGLELYKNEIGDEGAMWLARDLMMGVCPELNYLGLSINQIGDSGAHVLLLMLQSLAKCLPYFENLDLKENHIGTSMCARIKRVKRKGLRVQLEGNQTKPWPIIQRWESLPKNVKIAILILWSAGLFLLICGAVYFTVTECWPCAMGRCVRPFE